MMTDFPAALATFMRVVAACIMFFSVLPLMARELKSKGLGRLPHILFVLGTIYGVSALFTVYITWCRVSYCGSNEYLSWLSVGTAFGTLCAAIAWFLIYRQKY